MQERFLKRLLCAIKCGFCGNRYDSSNISVIGQQEGLWFFSAFCPACRSQTLIVAVIQEEQISDIITEPIQDEYAEPGESAVTIDDVLDMHNLLKAFRGKVSGLLQED